MSDKFVVIAADKISISGLAPLTEDDRFEALGTRVPLVIERAAEVAGI